MPSACVSVVAIGAEKGDLPALRALLASLPGNTAMAVLVVVADEDGAEPLTAGLLQPDCRMPVLPLPVDLPAPIAAGRVYLLPEGTELSLTEGQLRATPSDAAEDMPFDRVLRRLAGGDARTVAAVILSRQGRDGIAGAAHLRAAGGVVLAQLPRQGESAERTLSAIAAGAVDQALPLGGMAAVLADFAASVSMAAGPGAIHNLRSLRNRPDKPATRSLADDILDTIRPPLLILDGTGRVIRASRSYRDTFARKPEPLLRRSLFDLHGGQWDAPMLRFVIGRALCDDPGRDLVELAVTAPDGTTREWLLSARRLRGGHRADGRILLSFEDATPARQPQRQLQNREARLSAIVDAVPEAMIITDAKGIVHSYSPAAEGLLGYSAAEVIGRNVAMLIPGVDQQRHNGFIQRYLDTGTAKVIGTGRELNARHADGRSVPIRLVLSELELAGKRHFLGIVHDLTENRRRRAKMQRIQKMEAVGHLTGGLAHDFNNLLTVVIGNLEALESRLSGAEERELLNEALDASNLGASLTGKLLSFSRIQTLDPVRVSLNDLVDTIAPLLVRTLGKMIAFDTRLDPALDDTIADSGQVQSALLNLTLNARDAMKTGGRLTVTTHNAELAVAELAAHLDVDPGRYVALTVTDTGCGMTPEVLQQAVEPFFTTKGPGAGTGLGLSMVYGFAKQSRGHVTITSAPGAGTQVTLYLPSAGPAQSGRA